MKQNKNIKVIKKKIGLFSPADFVEKAKIAKAISRLSSSIENIEFITPPNLLKKHGLFAGTDKEKIADFVYIEKQNPDIMLGVKGGYGSARLIDKIDFKKISRSPIMGYSDLTSLIIADNSETGKINYYGFLLVPDFYEKTYNRQIKLFEEILNKTNLNYEFNCEIIKTPTSGLKSVKAEISIAGCLSILSGMLGTKYFRQIEKSNVMFIEDIKEEPYRIDRLITHLKNGGAFENTKCLFIDFNKCVSSEKNKGSISIKRSILEILEKYDFPVVDLPYFGHRKNKIVIPVGAKIKIDFIFPSEISDKKKVPVKMFFNSDYARRHFSNS